MTTKHSRRIAYFLAAAIAIFGLSTSSSYACSHSTRPVLLIMLGVGY